jgi:hypothetical protein
MYNNNTVGNNTTIFIGGGRSLGNLNLGEFYIQQSTKLLTGTVIGSGGGGSSGWADVAGATTTPGGGGGGSGAVVTFLFPCYLAPSVLNIRVGGSPNGGAASRLASNAGAVGQNSYIFLGPGSTLSTLNIAAANGGGGSSAATTSTGGSTGSAGTRPNSRYPSISYFSTAGTGAAGNTTTTGTAVTPTHMVSGGAGGAGITNTNLAANGGAINAKGKDPGIPGLSATQTSSCPVGVWRPEIHGFYSVGGPGGGSASGAAGGNGGNGGIGSGGGGGGASNSAASNSGAGGMGGPGMVLIVEI